MQGQISMTLMTLNMTSGNIEYIFIELAVPNNPYFDPEILSLVLLESILYQKCQTITNLTLQYDLADLEDDLGNN